MQNLTIFRHCVVYEPKVGGTTLLASRRVAIAMAGIASFHPTVRKLRNDILNFIIFSKNENWDSPSLTSVKFGTPIYPENHLSV
jgi:hypothetical protein